MAAQLRWSTRWQRVLDWQPPFAKWFVGGTLNLADNCLDRHLDGPRRNKAALIWVGEPEGETRVLTYQALHREVCRFANVLRGLGVRKGDRVGIYLPDDPRGGGRDARLRPHRRDPQRGLRRILGGGPARPHERRPGERGGHRGRRLAARRHRAAQGERRRRAGRGALCEGRRRRPADGRVGADAGGPRPLVPRADGRRLGGLPARAARQRASALHPLHQRHDGEAEGRRPHHRRLPPARGLQRAVGVRPEGGGHLLVHRRHRLGDGAQLRRLRPAGERRHERHVRGRAEPPAARPPLADHRRSRRHGLLHRADGDPRVREMGRGVAAPA